MKRFFVFTLAVLGLLTIRRDGSKAQGFSFSFWCADALELIEYLGSLFPDQEAVGYRVLRFR
jgi:hypothetical protein